MPGLGAVGLQIVPGTVRYNLKAEEFLDTLEFQSINAAHTTNLSALDTQKQNALNMLGTVPQYTYQNLDAYYEYQEMKAMIYADYEAMEQAEITNYCKAMAIARTNFEINKVNRMLALANQMATARKTYETAVANATQTALTGLAPKVETYRNAVATAWGTAVTAIYNEFAAVVTQWKNTAGTDSDWSGYVLDLVNNAKAEATTLVNKYKTNASANAAAEKITAIAQATAAHTASNGLANLRETASKDAAQRSADLQIAKWTAQKDLEVALVPRKTDEDGISWFWDIDWYSCKIYCPSQDDFAKYIAIFDNTDELISCKRFDTEIDISDLGNYLE
jgi:hypothetical protein